VRTFRLLSKEVIEWGNVRNLYVEVVHLDFLLERSHSVLFHDMPGKVLDGDNPVWYPRICGDFVLIMLVYYEKDLEEDYFLKLSTQSCCSLPMAALRTLVRSLVDFFFPAASYSFPGLLRHGSHFWIYHFICIRG
jgi:hypothetical protein